MLSFMAANYNSSAHFKACFSSIVSTAGNESLEFFVVGSGSKEEEVHYYNQSVRQHMKVSQEKYNYSLDNYLGKHFRGQLFYSVRL